MRMHDVDHTHPHTGEPFGFRIEPYAKVVADGGESEGGDGDGSEDGRTMADVSHEAGEGATRTFERGTEGRVHNE